VVRAQTSSGENTMGLFDKIKSIANAVSGGAAKVYVEAREAKLRAPFEVTVRAQSQGSDVKYGRVYLKIQSIEKVEVPDIDVAYEEEGTILRKRETVGTSANLFAQELTVAGSGMIKANESAEWKATVALPDNAAAEFKGKYSEHYYQIFAGLDCVGNDPDSGWVRLNLR
jgi:hypothetical protein